MYGVSVKCVEVWEEVWELGSVGGGMEKGVGCAERCGKVCWGVGGGEERCGIACGGVKEVRGSVLSVRRDVGRGVLGCGVVYGIAGNYVE